MPHYPHMMREDTTVWTRFLQMGSVSIKEVWYDVHCGQAVFLRDSATQMEQRIADGVTRKRIDVVASVDGGLWVIEIKPYGNMFAIGQILTYVKLLKQEYIVPDIVLPVIICNNIDPDILDEIDDFGILAVMVD